MKKMKEVTPYQDVYRVWSRVYGEWSQHLISIEEAIKLCVSISRYFDDIYFSEKLNRRDIPDKICPRHNVSTCNCHFYRLNNYGELFTIVNITKNTVVHINDIRECWFELRRKMRRKNNNDQHDRGKDLIQYKNNISKIKNVYSSKLSEYSNDYYAGKLLGTKGFNTLKEIKQLNDINDDYLEYNLVRGKRKNLPQGWWNDYYCSAYNTIPSWKHHSKRKKQWIPK